MRLYLDDDVDSNALIGLLRQAGHDVLPPRGLGTRGVQDEEHLAYAAAHGRILLTGNARHFLRMHEEWMAQQRGHPGILALYREGNPARDMSLQQIAHAVSRIEEAGVPLASSFHNLNRWRARRE